MSSMLFLHLLAIHGFWYAPFYGWLLMVSAWARRATFLWAALPPLLLGAFEKAVLGTTKFGKLMGLRLEGGDGFNFPPDKAMHSMPLRDLGMFLTSPRLWAGLALTALFLAAAVRLRRYREPI
jgi:ABC-2 type transport system permease protein